MYQSSIETAIKDAVGFKFLSRGFETAIKVHVENALFFSFFFQQTLRLQLDLQLQLYDTLKLNNKKTNNLAWFDNTKKHDPNTIIQLLIR